MLKLVRSLSLIIFVCLGVSAYAQSGDDAEYQEYLRKSKEETIRKQKLIDAQKGVHYGFDASFKKIYGWEAIGSMKFGLNAFINKRLSEFWMIGGLAGVEYLTPSHVTDHGLGNNYVYDRPAIDFTVMGEARFYFGYSEVMPYVYTNAGFAVSSYLRPLLSGGIGIDYNFMESKTIYIAVGFGADAIPYREYDEATHKASEDLKSANRGALSVRFGYYF